MKVVAKKLNCNPLTIGICKESINRLCLPCRWAMFSPFPLTQLMVEMAMLNGLFELLGQLVKKDAARLGYTCLTEHVRGMTA